MSHHIDKRVYARLTRPDRWATVEAARLDAAGFVASTVRRPNYGNGVVAHPVWEHPDTTIEDVAELVRLPPYVAPVARLVDALGYTPCNSYQSALRLARAGLPVVCVDGTLCAPRWMEAFGEDARLLTESEAAVVAALFALAGRDVVSAVSAYRRQWARDIFENPP